MPKPIAVWNPARGVWEVPETENLICEHSDVFSETWPSSGTTRNGWAYAQPTWVPRTDGSESSSLLGTPRSQHGEERNSNCWVRPLDQPQNLENQLARLLPNQRGSSGDLMLPSAVHHLLPTPAVNDMGEGKTVEKWDEWTAVQKAKHGNGNGHGPSLAIEALRLPPTPNTAGSRREATTHAGGNLTLQGAVAGVNPVDAERHRLRLGARMNQPSDAGNECSDE